MTAPVPLHRLIGARLRKWREAAGLLQEDIAAHARNSGFDWVRGTVAMIESGRRRITLEEFLELPLVLQDALPGNPNVQLHSLIEDGHSALLTPLAAIPTSDLRDWLRGRIELAPRNRGAPAGFAVDHIPDMPESPEIRTLWRRWFSDGPAPGPTYRAALDSRGDAEAKAARTLGVTPIAVTIAGYALWERSLTAERERRLAVQIPGDERLSTPARKIQALRGHITRELLGELRKDISTKMQGKKSTKRRAR